MRITKVKTTPLAIPFRQAYHWSHGTSGGTTTILVEVHTDSGAVGYGECLAWASADATQATILQAAKAFEGRSPHEVQALIAEVSRRHALFLTPRHANQMLVGLEMAMWDLIGKAAGQPVHKILGGAVHDSVGYFAFLQGGTPQELADDARRHVEHGAQVIYVKIGYSEAYDVEAIALVRDAIGDRRLRIDPNEAWDVHTAIRMIRKLERFEPEFIEQPVPSHSIDALKQVKDSVGVSIAADQAVYTLSDVYEVCRRRAADVIVLGLHEAGGLTGLRKSAAIAEAAGINLCLHGLRETGITTSAANQAAATFPNLDDGNQIMPQLLAHDIISAPDLTLTDGRLGVVGGVGLGFELDWDAVGRAHEHYLEHGMYVEA